MTAAQLCTKPCRKSRIHTTSTNGPAGTAHPRATNSARIQIHRLNRVWHSTHLFPTALQPSTHPQFPEAVTPSPQPVQTSCCCTEGPEPLKCSPEPVHDFYRKMRYRKLHVTEEIELFTSKVASLEQGKPEHSPPMQLVRKVVKSTY